MKAPDKIYLNTPKIQPELDNTTWDTKTYADCENIEYIRKDTLLEWVKLVYGKLSMNPFDCSEAFEELINKIELL